MTDTKTDLYHSLAEAHDRHIDRLGEILDTQRRTGARLDIEPLLRNEEDGMPLRDGVLNLPVHCDYAELGPFDRTETTLSVRSCSQEELSISGFVSDAEIWVSPFEWNALDVRFRLDADWPNFKPLRHWYLEWALRPPQGAAYGLRGVLHRLSGPTPSAGGWGLQLDLGSAAPEAVITLIETLSDIGAETIELGCCLSVDTAQ